MQSSFYYQTISSIQEGFLNGSINSLKSFWYIWLILIILGVVRISLYFYLVYKLNKAGLPKIDKMSGTDFERFLAQLFRKLGYKVEPVGGIEDYGADLIIEKDNLRTAVQAKRWNHPINVKAIQEINSSKVHYNATKGMVVTNNRFTRNAKILANENNVQLVDRKRLATLILRRK